MNRLLSSLRTHAEHWKKALLGPVVGIGLLFYQQVTGKPLAWGWFVALIFAGLVWHLFGELEKAKHDFEVPKLFLRYRHAESEESPNGFYVQVENDKKAFAVKITSEDTVGKDHMLLRMAWSDTPGPVGKERKRVGVICSLHLGNKSQSTLGDAVTYYLDNKSTGPKELTATVNFKDIDGRDCPSKKFRIYRQRDVEGFVQICCEPIQEQN